VLLSSLKTACRNAFPLLLLCTTSSVQTQSCLERIVFQARSDQWRPACR
jgi:hypothetical protein